ncbi:MAG: ribose-phosphate pyrophosphokinase-like domain-containing protein, partial [Rhodocyclaceae bacterium]|nr:ribose-phosphate pyrophosphokinase-like domain-containing protein [Rhodocyclaceae bacterium]
MHPANHQAGGADFILFTGNANRPFAEEMAQVLGIELGRADVGRFSDGEVTVEI